MFNSSKAKRRVVAWWSLFAIVLNLFQPAFVALTLAPIIIPSDVMAEELVESSPAPSPAATIEPTTTPEPTLPTDSPAPTLDSNQPVNPEPTPDSSPSPPDSEPTPEPTPLSTASPNPEPSLTPSPTPASDSAEALQVAFVENNLASSVEDFDFSVQESSSATLLTDKADYAPTDTALITGSGFLPSTTYTLIISSSDHPATSTSVDVLTNPAGELTYAYQLDGIYRPNYKVEAYLGSTLVTTATFTDSIVYTFIDDTAGANDVPGQKDLTRLGRDLSSSNPLYINWNWDEVSMSGNNTADGCVLFDTNNNGMANYALCVTWGGCTISALYKSAVV